MAYQPNTLYGDSHSDQHRQDPSSGFPSPVSRQEDDPFSDDPSRQYKTHDSPQYRSSPSSASTPTDQEYGSRTNLNAPSPRTHSDNPDRSNFNNSSIYPYHSGSNPDVNNYLESPHARKQGLSSDNESIVDVDPKTESSAFGRQNFQDFEYADPYNTAATPQKDSSFITLLFGGGGTAKYPLEQKIEAKRRGYLIRQTRPYVVWALSAAMAGVFIYELVVNWKAQGTPFSFKPYVNPLLGPSQAALINLGARFPPCMKHVEEVPSSMLFTCLNNTSLPPTSICTIEEVCGFGGFKGGEPNQAFRFFTAIFLHGGVVHILLNMFAQMTLSAHVEKEMGSIGFTILYFAAGIFGNVFGGNFSMVGLPSVGASGAIFGTVAVGWVDLFAHWQFEHKPFKKLAILTIELIIGVAIGFIPAVDNFAHIGGFLLGLLSAIAFYPIISTTKTHTNVVWVCRLVALVLAIVLIAVLTRNFYSGDPYKACSWCRYLSCIPTSSNDHCKGTGLSTQTIHTTPASVVPPQLPGA